MTSTLTATAQPPLGQIPPEIRCAQDYEVTARRFMAAPTYEYVAGGSGQELCSGDMLMEALVACAGVTMKAVAISLGIELRDATVRAEGDIDSRGTLGIAKDAAVGFQRIRLSFDLDTDASAEQVATLVRLTERYCVIFQTLAHPPEMTVTHRVGLS